MKKVLSLTLAFIIVLGLIPVAGLGAYAVTDGVTLSSTSQSAKYDNLNEAINAAQDGGTITVLGTYTMPSNFSWTSHGKSVTITGDTFDASAVSTLNVRDSVTFDAIALKWTGKVYANGNALKVDSDVTVTGTLDEIYGGGSSGTTVASTSLTLLSGNYKAIYGGSNGGTVSGDTNVHVGGNTNDACDTSNHDKLNTIYGGGNNDTIRGDTHVTFADNAKASYIYGGSYNASAKIEGTAYLNTTGGNAYSIYGAGRNVDCVKNTVTTITGGTFEQIFGGSEGSAVTGNVVLRVFGGTISRRIYGGCYNNYENSWQSSNGVSGTITLVLGSGTNVTFSSSDSDKGIFACSRHKTNLDGTAILVYSDASAKTKVKAGRYTWDFAGALIMSKLSAYDTVYTLSHSTSGATITETGGPSTATATLKVDASACQYTGAALTPAYIEYSDGWLGEPLGEVTYANNVQIGTATASATLSRESLTVSTTFDVWAPAAETILAIVEDRTAISYTLKENASFAGTPIDGDTLTAIVAAVDSGRIILNGYSLTDLSVSIATKEQLSSIKSYTRGVFTLTNDINMSGTVLSAPALTLVDSTLNGRGYSIYGYSVTDCGLIAVDGEATVKNLSLGKPSSAISVSSGTATAATLTAVVPEGASLNAVNVTVYVSGMGDGSIGGLVGDSLGTLSLDGCESNGAISVGGTAGGFIASAVSANVTDSLNACSVTASTAGALSGFASGDITVSDFTNNASISAGTYAGGVVGRLDGNGALTATDILNVGSVANAGESVGAYAGMITSIVTGDASVYIEGAVNIGKIGSATAGSGTIVGYTDTGAVTVKSSVNAGKALQNTDTQIVYGGSPVLEGNSSLSLENSNGGTETLADLAAARALLNGRGGDFMLSVDGTRLVCGTPVFYGVQRSETTTVEKDGVKKDVFSVRFVAVINDTLDYKRLGLRLRVGNGEYFEQDTDYVFTTLLQTGSGGEQTEISADALGGAYVYAAIVNNVPINGISSDGSVTFYVTPYAIDDAGNEYIGAEQAVTYTYGAVTRNAN